MKVTTNHPASHYGVPIILNNRGDVIDYDEGVKAIRRAYGLSTADLGSRCGVSSRTVENWEQGRRAVPASALNVMADICNKSP